jgi:hypothetical protein
MGKLEPPKIVVGGMFLDLLGIIEEPEEGKNFFIFVKLKASLLLTPFPPKKIRVPGFTPKMVLLIV